MTRLYKQRTARVLLRFPWHTQVFGRAHRSIESYRSTKADRIQRFAEKLIKASKGEKGIVEPTFVYLPGVPGGDEIVKETGVDFFSVPVELGVRSNRSNPDYAKLKTRQPSGVEKATNPIPNISADEKQLLEAAKTELKGNVEKGIEFVRNPPPK